MYKGLLPESNDMRQDCAVFYVPSNTV